MDVREPGYEEAVVGAPPPAGAHRAGRRKAKLGTGIGWHTFRHTYSSMLRHLGVDVKVQQELLRHADIRTTMNTYTQAMPTALREANSRVARMVVQ
jgi:integrase